MSSSFSFLLKNQKLFYGIPTTIFLIYGIVGLAICHFWVEVTRVIYNRRLEQPLLVSTLSINWYSIIQWQWQTSHCNPSLGFDI